MTHDNTVWYIWFNKVIERYNPTFSFLNEDNRGEKVFHLKHMYPIEFSSNLITGEMHTVMDITLNRDSTFLKIGKICSLL